MTDYRPLDSRGARRRKAILDAALELFSEQGFDRVSVRAISKRAGASTETIYRHFGDKEGLLRSVATAISQSMAAVESEAEATPEGAPEEVLTNMGRAFLNVLLTPEALGFLRLAIREALGSQVVARAFWEGGPEQTRDRLARYLEAQCAAGGLHLDDPELSAHQFFGMLHSTLHLKVALGLEKPTRAGIDAHVANAVTLFLDGCRTRPGTAGPSLPAPG